MIKINTAASTLLLLSFNTYAADPVWLSCRDMPNDKQLDCYQHATEQYLDDKKTSETITTTTATTNTTIESSAASIAATPSAASNNYGWKLDKLWPKANELSAAPSLANTFIEYKQNYLIADLIRNPSPTPSSPNASNSVTTPVDLKSEELKFQISLKAQVPYVYPWGDTMWLTYTQQSHWQAFNGKNSRPFRESNYAPEFIFLSHRFGDAVPTLGPLTPRLFNLTYVHQSNGESLPRSRSWNRLTAQLGSEYRFKSLDADAEEKRLVVLIRPWWRIPEHSRDDDNHDITQYLGHGDIEFDYWRGRTLVSAMFRNRAVQLDWSFPLSNAVNALNLHLQYFGGYGESLIDYNHKLHSFGIGISLPY